MATCLHVAFGRLKIAEYS